MSKKYVDIPATMQVMGSIYNDPNLLDSEDKYFFHESDFTTDFHKIIFGSIYNLHALGVSKININTIEDYLAERPTKLAIYKANHGAEYLTKIREQSSFASFDYYYNKLKKMTLMREYSNIGMDLSWLYDVNNIIDVKKKQAQEDWLDRTALEEIADIIDGKIQEVRDAYVNDIEDSSSHLGDGIFDLLERLKETPDVGIPLYGPIVNTVTRGARLGKFYLRSAPTGVGKSRSMIADSLFCSCNELWNEKAQEWIPLTTKQPTLLISTELESEELQTISLAFVSGVNETHIVESTLSFEQTEKVHKAAQIISESPIYVEQLPDFSLKDIETTIKKNIRERDVRYIFLDYIHTSMKILEEVTRRSGGVKLREDNILFMISVKLKDIANKYKVFIMSATQLNGDYVTSKTPDQNLLRGAKAIADKADFGCIMLDVTQADLDSLQTVLGDNGFEAPTVKMSIYKNRGGPYKGIYLWMRADKGTSRFETIFATKWNFELLPITETRIIVEG